MKPWVEGVVTCIVAYPNDFLREKAVGKMKRLSAELSWKCNYLFGLCNACDGVKHKAALLTTHVCIWIR